MTLPRNIDVGLLILRFTFALLTLLHGWYHLSTGLAAVKEMLHTINMPEFLAYGVLVGEIIAPLLILIGWQTRLASVMAVFNFLMTILIAHTAELFSLTPYGGWALELNILYMVIPLALIFTGAGKYALDRH